MTAGLWVPLRAQAVSELSLGTMYRKYVSGNRTGLCPWM